MNAPVPVWACLTVLTDEKPAAECVNARMLTEEGPMAGCVNERASLGFGTIGNACR